LAHPVDCAAVAAKVMTCGPILQFMKGSLINTDRLWFWLSQKEQLWLPVPQSLEKYKFVELNMRRHNDKCISLKESYAVCTVLAAEGHSVGYLPNNA